MRYRSATSSPVVNPPAAVVPAGARDGAKVASSDGFSSGTLVTE